MENLKLSSIANAICLPSLTDYWLLDYSESEYKLEDKNGLYTAKLQGIYICDTCVGNCIALNHLNFSDSKDATLLIGESDLSPGAYMKF